MEEVRIEYQVIGRIERKEDKVRPLRIKLNDVEDKRRVLSRARNLKKVEGMDKIYIVSDLTKTQQEEEKKLREEVKRIREQGDLTARISKGVIVRGAVVSNDSAVRIA